MSQNSESSTQSVPIGEPIGEPIIVSAGSHQYEVLVGQDILSDLGRVLSPLLTRRKIAVIADPQARAAQGDKLSRAIDRAELDATIIDAPSAGEQAKTFASLEKICADLLEAHIERDDLILSFGGGAVGDLTGLAASLIRRGVRVVHIPTTLLAQVDSAIGGKTGINTAQGKNLIGTFHQPSLVIIDPSLLDTLSAKEFLSGYAEIVKYGVIGNENFFGWLEQNKDKIIARDKAALLHAITTSCQAKAAIVSQDEKEHGQRALLNLGHSFGHALEIASAHKLLHGEAVAIGIALACKMSAALGLMAPQQAARVTQHLEDVGLPTRSCLLDDADKIVDIMRQDKKTKQGQLTLILAKNIGEAVISRDLDFDDLHAFFTQKQDKSYL